MKSRFWLFLLTFFAAFAPVAFAQNPVKFSATFEPKSPRVGENGRVVLTLKMDKGWHIYAPDVKGGPIASKFELAPNPHLKLAGKIALPKPKSKFDEGFKTTVTTYSKELKVGFPVQITAKKPGAYKANLSVLYQACTDRMCLPPKMATVPVSFTVQKGAARGEFSKPNTSVPAQIAQGGEGGGNGNGNENGAAANGASAVARSDAPIQRGQGNGGSLLGFMLAAFGAGFLAILTPCVFPMIPITVSLFSKRGSGLSGPVAYCAGIIGTFTVLGVAVSLLFGAAGLSLFAANPWVNLALAGLFIVLALNLFGVFEIIVPASLLSKVQPKPGAKQSLLAPVLMGFAFTLTSFTCTVPFVGTALVSAATQGPLFPLLGMLCFSTAFALPFFLLALFPSALQKLPRAGSWLVSVKAFMGFLELAAALKFLQTADYTLNLGLITRPVFLAIWFAIALIAGCYLLRWLRLPKDDESTQIGPFRRTLGFATLGAALLLLSANNGRSLGDLNAYLPPRDYGSQSNRRYR